jgi:hypothetical protein
MPQRGESDEMAIINGNAMTLRAGVAGFFLWTSGIHVGIVAADTEFYRGFADGSMVPIVRSAWRDVFMAAPVGWGLAVAAGELGLALLLLKGGRSARLGWLGVIAFQVLLVLFGWGFLLWTIPALIVLVPGARKDWPRLAAGTARRLAGQPAQ